MSNGLFSTQALFEGRFEPEGDGYLFRHALTSPGYRVSAEERDRFVADFARTQKRALRTAFILMLVLGLAGVAWIMAFGGKMDVPIAMTVFGLTLVNVVVVQRAWDAPRRALSDRAPVSEGLSKDQGKREGLRRLRWTNLAAVCGVAALVAWNGYAGDPQLSGHGRAWLGMAGFLVVLVAVQAFRKWRVERGD